MILLDGEHEFNSRIFVFAGIIIFLLVVVFFPYQILEKPVVVNLTSNLTLTTEDKISIYSKLTPLEREKVSNYLLITPTPVIITNTVYVTPTPDNGIYYSNEYIGGIKKLGRPFSWARENVVGLQDMSVHVRVYNYKILQSYHWWNPTDYKYYETYPSNINSEFLFVYVNIYMDDIIGDDPRMWLPNEHHYFVNINGQLIEPIEFTKQLRIKEFEETFNWNDDNRIKYYGGVPTYTANSDAAPTAGEIVDNLTYLRGGISNAVDGYIVYEVPANTPLPDISVVGTFYTFGQNSWLLKE